MKILHLNYSDRQGGAAKAAYRIHRALLNLPIESKMAVEQATLDDWTVINPKSKISRTLSGLRPAFNNLVNKLLTTDNPSPRSLGLLPSNWPKRLSDCEHDVLHLHWINNEMLSIAELGKIKPPIVWTLHDMWAFCGAEHYNFDQRWKNGYTPSNRPPAETGLDLNLWTWRRKRRHWRQPMHIVAPSQWLADCARESALFRQQPVSVIPNAIDTEFWRPLDKTLARELLDLPRDSRIILFGAVSGSKDPRKGFDLLKASLDKLNGELNDACLVVFGQCAPQHPPALGLPIHFTGPLNDELSLRLLYNAADVVIIPSKAENLSNIGLEAAACGVPVVAFETGGMPDLVKHQQTGYLARAFDATDLAAGIVYILSDRERYRKISNNARQDCILRFAYPVVARQYLELYRQVLTVK